jgi:hypothetical protein
MLTKGMITKGETTAIMYKATLLTYGMNIDELLWSRNQNTTLTYRNAFMYSKANIEKRSSKGKFKRIINTRTGGVTFYDVSFAEIWK